jgi:hypothetical protein
MPRFLLSFAIVFFTLVCVPLRAAVVVIGNGTGESQRLEIKPDSSDAKIVTLQVGETRVFRCNVSAELTFSSKGKESTLKLDAYSAYILSSRNGVLDVQGVKLEGNAPPVANLPTAELTATPVKISVKMLVDDADRRTRLLWA